MERAVGFFVGVVVGAASFARSHMAWRPNDLVDYPGNDVDEYAASTNNNDAKYMADARRHGAQRFLVGEMPCGKKT